MNDDQSDPEMDTETSTDWESIIICLFIILFGVSVLIGITYANMTTTTETNYEEFQNDCGELANSSRLVDGGVGLMRQSLNQTAVATCQSTTYTEYHQRRVQSMRTTPFNFGQWAAYGSVGGGAIIGGLILGMRSRRLSHNDK
ncbi:hypothetical protein [Haloquadratum walsbyi]|jgi:hypothetical protein|uniref:Uncharacterized protein n=1 Tax=Haloquadratum walsbyi J07HQW2 TaxID=1238425 RepID=U1NCL0_9EURY|nr:hypothetical protein [Haloquadratum walsbyi]ERG94670.1 MAG: hypothetical protein J07HQW2_01107 [Haloquadratum walsbyi J07HQW2]